MTKTHPDFWWTNDRFVVGELVFFALRFSGAFSATLAIPPAMNAKIGLVIAFNRQSKAYIVKATPIAAAGATLGLDHVLAG